MGFLEEFYLFIDYLLDSGFFWRYKKSRMFVCWHLAVDDDVVVAGCLGIVVVVVMRKKGSLVECGEVLMEEC